MDRPVSGDLRFTTATPTDTWEAGLITGSGRVGAIVHGAPDRLRIALAHERFFLPANPRPPAPDMAAALPGMRRHLLAGDAAAASEAMVRAARASGYDGLVWTDPLGMCATLSLSTPGGVTDFTRTTDLASGIVTVAWHDAAGSAHRVHALAPRGTDTVWVAIEADAAARTTVRIGLDDVADGGAASFAPDYTGAVSGRVHPGRACRLDVLDGVGEALVQVRASAGVPAGSGMRPPRRSSPPSTYPPAGVACCGWTSRSQGSIRSRHPRRTGTRSCATRRPPTASSSSGLRSISTQAPPVARPWSKSCGSAPGVATRPHAAVSWRSPTRPVAHTSSPRPANCHPLCRASGRAPGSRPGRRTTRSTAMCRTAPSPGWSPQARPSSPAHCSSSSCRTSTTTARMRVRCTRPTGCCCRHACRPTGGRRTSTPITRTCSGPGAVAGCCASPPTSSRRPATPRSWTTGSGR